MLPSAPHRALADWDRLHFLLCPSLIALRLLGKDGEKEKGCPTRQQEGQESDVHLIQRNIFKRYHENLRNMVVKNSMCKLAS